WCCWPCCPVQRLQLGNGCRDPGCRPHRRPGADLQRARRGPPGDGGHATRCSACSWGRLPVIRVAGRAGGPGRI
ncbi:hypothetical protein, partial [Aeromonas hydrophila]|uniref:hypothetical protein n=1 Tax=Aeromonas hydrophila TaxID=644 RepID=UPI0023615B81